jgi:hypothetical protein
LGYGTLYDLSEVIAEQHIMDFLPADINHFAAIARRRDLDREGKFKEALKLANVYYESGSQLVS